jgi:phenylacetic acid degradation operon negative regulatory protein
VKTPDPLLCFCLRTLLIHLYRRALLRDPQFPDSLMPPNWPAQWSANTACPNLAR